MSDSPLDILIANYTDSHHARAIVQLMDEYARDPYGGGEPLSDACREQLVDKLGTFPGAFSVLAFDGSEPVGLVNCFTGFSTFACKPLVNIHDVIVTDRARGRGVCGRMLELVAREAEQRGCCKLTMEVLEKNEPAQRAYRKVGFEPYVLDENMGAAHFWQRYL
ncbi:Acetyltransferase (GNAT) family protein [Microbulbifer aggregans]|uniref:Acetyltransferase (GNAT) family protein n=1 Tax=Microbulbifer aggregans TaxID=1769779 RepID=A0A1C9W361_9GAMM|nr:GNAT family N-acetyltransferase [Microbulbifer aggregans]AOS95569.1 Acetyltransferase (GNAT) family protein [Microbulbifer aggregans]